MAARDAIAGRRAAFRSYPGYSNGLSGLEPAAHGQGLKRRGHALSGLFVESTAGRRYFGVGILWRHCDGAIRHWRPCGERISPYAGNQPGARSEERRVGKEWVRTCRSRWSPNNKQKKKKKKQK